MPCLPFSIRDLRFRAKRQHSHLPPELPRPITPPDEPRTPATIVPYELLQVIFCLAMEPTSSDIDLTEKARLRSTIHSLSKIHSVDFNRDPAHTVAYLLPLSRPHLIDVGHRSDPFRVNGSQGLAVLNTLKGDCHRIRQWNIDVAPECRYLDVQDSFGIPKDDAALHPAHVLRQTGVINISDRAWRRWASSLQKLSLRDTNLVVTPPLDLCNLSELSITTIYRSVKYSILEVIAFLRKTPRLQLLCLKDTLAVIPGYNPIPANQSMLPVDLPKLRLVTVSESQWETAYLLLLLLPILRRPLQCGLDLFLPSHAHLRLEIDDALGRVRRSLHGVLWPSSLLALRVEMALQPHGFGYRFTTGTIPSHPDLDWNGIGGTIGVEQYLDDYSRTVSPTSAETLHPPFRVSICDPIALDISRVARTLNMSALQTTQSVRITVELLPRGVGNLDQLVRPIANTLREMRQVKTMTLDEGASIVILRRLRGRTYFNADHTPVPFLPDLEYIAIECSRPRGGEMGFLYDERVTEMPEIIRQYVEWRRRLGLPVDVLWVGSVADNGSSRKAGGSKRNGIISMRVDKAQA